MLNRRVFASVLTLAASLSGIAGCALDVAPTEQAGEHVSTAATPIIDGVASTAEDNSAVWIGVLTAEGYPAGMCTGVLLADNVVLTARHCVSRTSDGGIACKSDGTPIAGGGVRSDYEATRLAVIVGPTMSHTAAARGQQVLHTGAKNLCNNDIAVVVLDRRIEGAQIAPIRLNSAPEKGEKILAVGWGVSNNSQKYGRRRRAEIPISAVGPIASAATGAVGPNEFAIGEGICSGDSGGPAYSMTTGAVLGVVSRGGNGAPYNPETDPQYTQCVDSAQYRTHNLYTRVDTLKDLIYRAFEVAGGEPWVEGSYDPRKAKASEACESADACRSGICHEGACVEACVEGACGEGFTCTPGAESDICISTSALNAGAPGPNPKGKCAVGAPGAPSGAAWSSAFMAVAVAGLIAARRRR